MHARVLNFVWQIEFNCLHQGLSKVQCHVWKRKKTDIMQISQKSPPSLY